eukprot:Skav213658  [mRNA]  locus=scaffold2012:437371:440378:- [translate_table: standard]
MVLKIPALQTDLPGQFKASWTRSNLKLSIAERRLQILGLGDIAIPGLLVSLLLRHDLIRRHRRCRGYFLAGVIGYAFGLLATFVSLYLMQHGQPALLFLVPGTLIPTCFIALRKARMQNMRNTGELRELWSILSSIWLQGRIAPKILHRAPFPKSLELIVVMAFFEELEDDLLAETSFLHHLPSSHDVHDELQQSERDGVLGIIEILGRVFSALNCCLVGIGRLRSRQTTAQSPRTPAISPLPTLLRAPNGTNVPAGVPCHFIIVGAAAPP